ncbi:sodium:solute symporter family protein [Rudaeicoccus suwonensis]|uniref:SSS family solute:Na+ symporter n=1 Tax=Rudaeicoccus suwonensis TaxID=657409 RepID=A0A561E6R2_9MICO|nr:sodium:solute symporter [Rudaeicoccus suwonensis]TWE11284.1 SSS family solute:Na+ symporter [Rudaeicoccus suwonensis]
MNAALALLIVFFALSLGLGLWARRGKKMDLEGWSVGGRNFGSLIVFLLLAGEIYTTFTFLGASGWAYAHGGAAYYILCYGSLAYVISYWLAPAIWRYGKKMSLLSQPDWWVAKYKSRTSGTVVAIVGIVAMVPYLELQLAGLGIIVNATSYGKISTTTAEWCGAVALVAYVVVSGIHAAATNAIVKDVIVLVIVVILGIYLPLHIGGGFEHLFHHLDGDGLPAAWSHNGVSLHLSEPGYDMGWFISNILMSTLGFFMWPHYFGAVYAAERPKTFRRNAVLLPLYQLVILFVFFIGFTAALALKSAPAGGANNALLEIVTQELPQWIVGLVGAAGLFCALVPGAMLLTTCGTLISSNLYKPLFPKATATSTSVVAKASVPVVALVSLYLLFQGGQAIVNLLLLGYAFVTQLLPSMLASLLKKNPISAWGATSGMVVGALLVTWFSLDSAIYDKGVTTFGFLPSGMHHVAIGLVALVANIIVMVAVSAVTPRVRPQEPVAAGA